MRIWRLLEDNDTEEERGVVCKESSTEDKEHDVVDDDDVGSFN